MEHRGLFPLPLALKQVEQELEPRGNSTLDMASSRTSPSLDKSIPASDSPTNLHLQSQADVRVLDDTDPLFFRAVSTSISDLSTSSACQANTRVHHNFMAWSPLNLTLPTLTKVTSIFNLWSDIPGTHDLEKQTIPKSRNTMSLTSLLDRIIQSFEDVLDG